MLLRERNHQAVHTRVRHNHIGTASQDENVNAMAPSPAQERLLRATLEGSARTAAKEAGYEEEQPPDDPLLSLSGIVSPSRIRVNPLRGRSGSSGIEALSHEVAGMREMLLGLLARVAAPTPAPTSRRPSALRRAASAAASVAAMVSPGSDGDGPWPAAHTLRGEAGAARSLHIAPRVALLLPVAVALDSFDGSGAGGDCVAVAAGDEVAVHSTLASGWALVTVLQPGGGSAAPGGHGYLPADYLSRPLADRG